MVVALCVVHSIAGVGIVAGSPTESSASDEAFEMAQETETPVNNSTTQQENPEEVDEAGNAEAVRRYLAQKLAERLAESSVRISQGQYERGQSVLGDEYDELLEKYVDVEGETEDNSASQSFEEAGENQREFGSAVEEYNETYQEYLEAKEAGNTTRARELARELDRIADRMNSSGRNLTRSYTDIENTTTANLTVARERVENTTREIQQQQDEVVASTFIRTSLSVRTDSSTTSFEDPLTIYGRLVLENGTALSNETVQISIGGKTETVETDRDGQFSLDFRPVSVGTGNRTVSVTYLPPERSAYLGSNASLAINVSQVTATVTVSSNTSTAMFGDELTVSGLARVNGTPVPGAKVQVTVGGQVLGTAITGPNGTYQVAISLPAAIPTGTTTIKSLIVPSDRAVHSDPATTNLDVVETQTNLSLNASQTGASVVQLSGTLQTADGRPLSGQTIELRVDGSTVATVETRADGTFQRTVSLNDELSGEITVRAVYDEPRSNLAGSTAQTRLELQSADSFNPDFEQRDWLSLSVEQLASGGVVALALIIILWIVRRDEEEPDPELSAAPPDTQSEASSEPEVDMVDQASSLLSAGDSEAAIRTLYAAVRESLGTGDDGTLTHWEFYTAASDRLEPEAVGALEQLTEAYERVVYSAGGVDASVAAKVLEESESILGEQSGEVSNGD